MYIHNTTHLSARLIEHIPHSADSQKIKFPSEEYMKITFKMFEFYKNIENRYVTLNHFTTLLILYYVS